MALKEDAQISSRRNISLTGNIYVYHICEDEHHALDNIFFLFTLLSHTVNFDLLSESFTF